jgi:sulfur carrier protein ThiS
MLTIPNLNYPGINVDEASDGIVTSYILKDVSNNPKSKLMITNCYIILFNKIFPIMSGEYLGSVSSYLIFPFSLIFGLNVISLRVTSIFISALTILFIYFSCKIWFGRRVAFLASLLTATNLLFVQYSRVGLHREEIFIIFFFWAGLFFLAKYSEAKKNLFLYLSLYSWGLGLSAKIIFLWYAIGLIVAYLILRKRVNLLLSLKIRQKIIVVLSFGLGAIFIILYNIKSPGIIVRVLTHSLFLSPFKEGSSPQINNLDYLTNLGTRIPHLIVLLKGNIVDAIDWGVIKMYSLESLSLFIITLTFISFMSVLILTLFSRNKPIKYRILFFYILYFTVMALTPFTVSGFHPGHLLVLLPFPQIVMALFLDYIWQWSRQKKILLTTIYSIFLVPVLLFNIWMNIYFNIEMKKNGGYRRWSTAIYELADYLDRKNIQPLTFGCGLKENIAFLTNERIVPAIYDELKITREGLIKEYKRLYQKKEPIFYLTKMSEESQLFLNLFMKLAAENGKEKILEKIFFNRAGHPVYWLYKIY